LPPGTHGVKLRIKIDVSSNTHWLTQHKLGTLESEGIYRKRCNDPFSEN
jgi:hypothetical protein